MNPKFRSIFTALIAATLATACASSPQEESATAGESSMVRSQESMDAPVEPQEEAAQVEKSEAPTKKSVKGNRSKKANKKKNRKKSGSSN